MWAKWIRIWNFCNKNLYTIFRTWVRIENVLLRMALWPYIQLRAKNLLHCVNKRETEHLPATSSTKKMTTNNQRYQLQLMKLEFSRIYQIRKYLVHGELIQYDTWKIEVLTFFKQKRLSISTNLLSQYFFYWFNRVRCTPH